MRRPRPRPRPRRIRIRKPGGGRLDLRPGEGAPAGDVRRVVGEVELGGAASQAEKGRVEGTRRLLGAVVGAQPDSVAAVGQADFGDPLAPLALAHSLEAAGVAALAFRSLTALLHHFSFFLFFVLLAAAGSFFFSFFIFWMLSL